VSDKLVKINKLVERSYKTLPAVSFNRESI